MMSLEGMYKRHPVEDREPRDRKFRQDADAADLERGGANDRPAAATQRSRHTALHYKSSLKSLKCTGGWGKFIGWLVGKLT